MPRAKWNGVVIAESETYERVENNIYFPPGSVKSEYLRDSDVTSICHWKGKALYRHIEVDGKVNRNAAWFYPEVKEKANNIKGYTAFWKGVEIEM